MSLPTVVVGMLLLGVAAAEAVSLRDFPAPNAAFYQYFADQPSLACIMLNFSATFQIDYLDTNNTNRTRLVDISPANAVAEPTRGSCGDEFGAASVFAQLQAEPTFEVELDFAYDDFDATPTNWTIPTIFVAFQLNVTTFPGLDPQYDGKEYLVGWTYIPTLYSTPLHSSYECNFDNNRNNTALNQCSTFVTVAPDDWPWARGFTYQMHELQVQGNMTAQDANRFGPLGEECLCNFPFSTPKFLSY